MENYNPFYGVRSRAIVNFINVGVDDIMVIDSPIRIFSIFYEKVGEFLDLSEYKSDSPTAKFFEGKSIHKILLGLNDEMSPEKVLINESKGVIAIKFATSNEEIDNFFLVKTKCNGPAFIIQPLDSPSFYYYLTCEDGRVVVKKET